MNPPKPERILKAAYPDLALLQRLKTVRLGEVHVPEHEILQFRRLQSLIYALRVAGYDIEAMQTEAFIGAVLFTYVNCKVAVTRCEYDFEVSNDVIAQIAPRLPGDLVWFTTNATSGNSRVRPMPIGMTDYCGYSPYHAVIGDSEKFIAYASGAPRSQKNLVLMNFNDSTYPSVRTPLRQLFGGKDFVTADFYSSDETGYARYVEGLRSHPFCLAPRGNGIDTHRLWECLYAGCIPIVQKDYALREFQDLPIFFADRWEDACDENVLSRVLHDYSQREWDLGKLTLSHWYQHIRSFLR